MASLNRVNGSPATGGFYGFQGALVVVTASGKFGADAVDGTTKVITPGGYSGAVKALGQVGSLIWLGAQASGSFAAIVDGATLNSGPGATTSGDYGALKDALVSECGGTAGNYSIAVSTVLGSDGSWS